MRWRCAPPSVSALVWKVSGERVRPPVEVAEGDWKRLRNSDDIPLARLCPDEKERFVTEGSIDDVHVAAAHLTYVRFGVDDRNLAIQLVHRTDRVEVRKSRQFAE